MIPQEDHPQLISKLHYLNKRVQELALSLQLYQETSIQKRDELESSHQQLQSFVQSIGDPILVLDTRYRVVLANRKMREAAGGIDPAGASMPCHQFARKSKMPCKSDNEPCPARNILRTIQQVTMSQHSVKNGNTLFFDIIAAPVLNNKGRVVHIIESFRDITARIDLEEDFIRTARLAMKREKHWP